LLLLAQVGKVSWLPYHPLTGLTMYILFCTLDTITMTHDNNTGLNLSHALYTGCTVHPQRYEVMLSQMVNSVNIPKKCTAFIFSAKQSWVELRKSPKHNSSKQSVTHKKT